MNTDTPSFNYNHKSRVHRLRSFPSLNRQCFVKRDDELSFGISGSKMRKYCSLVPYLLNQKVDHALLIGGAFSNNVLGLSQLLIENGIKPLFFLRGEAGQSLKGNLLFTSLFADLDSIYWIPRSQWAQAESIAENHADLLKQNGHRPLVIPEGASLEPALEGALTLPLDIVRNECCLNLTFDHIFIEAGTGMMASTLIHAFAAERRTCKIHVLLLGEGESAFTTRLNHWQPAIAKLLTREIPINPHFKLYAPEHGASFGSVSASLFEEIKNIARTEGFLTDPIYSAKLFLESRRMIKEQSLTGNILIVHSGGALSLAGFQERLTKLL